MGVYLKSRFAHIMQITNDKISRTPSDHPSDMEEDMNKVLTDEGVPSGTSGAWYLVKYTSQTSPDAWQAQARNKYYVAYYAMDGTDILTSAKLVAAPCPPFCSDEKGG